MLVIAVTGAALAGSGSAWAYKGGHFEGAVNLEPASRISFDLVKTKKKIGHHRWRRTTKIENVVFEGAMAGCGSGVIAPVSTEIPGSVKLGKKGRFVLKAGNSGGSLSISGSFLRGFRVAYGDFRLAGTFEVDGELRTCDTGPRGWEARRS